LLFKDHRAEEAIALVHEGIQRLPVNPELVYRLSSYLYNNGQIAEAYRTFEDALSINPQLSKAVFEYSPLMANDQFIQDLLNTYLSKHD
jgi:tetratricopeptide (TPR) repeat protein